MTTQLKIEGMTCGHCVASVTKALKGVPEVEEADVSLTEGRATVRGNAELGALIQAVEEEGYSASAESPSGSGSSHPAGNPPKEG